MTSLYRCVLSEEHHAPGFADYTRRLRGGTLTPQDAYAEFFPPPETPSSRDCAPDA